jgi:hypothetical protein
MRTDFRFDDTAIIVHLVFEAVREQTTAQTLLAIRFQDLILDFRFESLAEMVKNHSCKETGDAGPDNADSKGLFKDFILIGWISSVLDWSQPSNIRFEGLYRDQMYATGRVLFWVVS